MKLNALWSIMCCDVVLVEYVDGDPEGKELLKCHSFHIPKEYLDRIVMSISPFDESLYLLLKPEHE